MMEVQRSKFKVQSMKWNILRLTALLCFVLTLPVCGQSNISLMPLIEANLVRNTGMIYLVVPGPLNNEPGQGKYFIVFYVGVVSPSNGIVAHAQGMMLVRQTTGMFTEVTALPCRDSLSGQVVMLNVSQPSLTLGDLNKLFFTRHDIENWYRSFNAAHSMLPSTLPEFQAVMGNNRNYEITLMSPRDTGELPFWDDLYGVEQPELEVVAVENFDSYMSGILFVSCVLFGVSLWGVFIDSFEKGTV